VMPLRLRQFHFKSTETPSQCFWGGSKKLSVRHGVPRLCAALVSPISARMHRCDGKLAGARAMASVLPHANANVQSPANAKIQQKLEFRTRTDSWKNKLKEGPNMTIQRCTSGWSAQAEEPTRLPQRVAHIGITQPCIFATLAQNKL
jgi:hypothetical protein